MFGELLRRYDLRFYFGFEKRNWKEGGDVFE